MKNVKKVVTTLILSLALSGLSQATELEDMGLTKIEDTGQRVVYLKTDQDFSKYDSIAIADIASDDVKVSLPSGSIAGESNWQMDEDRQARVEKLHREAFDSEFAAVEGFELVDGVDANTLVLVTRLSEVSPAVGYDPHGKAGRVNVYSKGSGSAVIEMFLVDGGTGEVVAAVANGRQLGHFARNNNSVTNASDAQFAFRAWARQAREAVENLPAMASEARG